MVPWPANVFMFRCDPQSLLTCSEAQLQLTDRKQLLGRALRQPQFVVYDKRETPARIRLLRRRENFVQRQRSSQSVAVIEMVALTMASLGIAMSEGRSIRTAPIQSKGIISQ